MILTIVKHDTGDVSFGHFNGASYFSIFLFSLPSGSWELGAGSWELGAEDMDDDDVGDMRGKGAHGMRGTRSACTVCFSAYILAFAVQS